jgi:hypothetical protein
MSYDAQVLANRISFDLKLPWGHSISFETEE